MTAVASTGASRHSRRQRGICRMMTPIETACASLPALRPPLKTRMRVIVLWTTGELNGEEARCGEHQDTGPRVCRVRSRCGGAGRVQQLRRAQRRPADDPGPPVIKVTLTKTGCSPQSFTLKPGPVRFSVTNPEPPEKSEVGLHDDPNGRPTEMEIQNAQGHEINDVEGVQPGRTGRFSSTWRRTRPTGCAARRRRRRGERSPSRPDAGSLSA